LGEASLIAGEAYDSKNERNRGVSPYNCDKKRDFQAEIRVKSLMRN
jgi:hypothetical protein